MAAHKGQLPAPGPAIADSRAQEVLRAWIVEGGLQVSLNTALEDPAVWGILLADVARHAARAYAVEGVRTESHNLKAIKHMFDAEWDRPTDLGQTRAAN